MILSTPDFKKPLLSISALLVVALLVVGSLSILNPLVIRAEQELGAFPFKEEDYLRYLLPSQFVRRDRPRIMLLGPSTVRENMLYEQFEAAFPAYIVYQGGITLGTLDDVNLALEYVERVYGREALPEIIVLGVAPRFIANIPDDRPFNDGIDHYSPYLKTVRMNPAVELVPKGLFESLFARARFFVYKKPEEIQTTLFAVLNDWMVRQSAINPGREHSGLGRAFQEYWGRIFKRPAMKRLIVHMLFKQANTLDVFKVLAWKSSPYKYRLSAPRDPEEMIEWANHEKSWWREVYSWNPKATEKKTLQSLRRFRKFLDTHHIKLLVVNMPERDVSRTMFNDENYGNYIALVKNSFGEGRFLDLREFLRPDEFFDFEHSVYSGSLRFTREVIRRLNQMLSSNG